MPIQTLSSQRLYQQAADHLADLIRDGEYPVDARLPGERELAKQLGVSRTTVREALISMEIAGLIDVRVGAGAYVKARQPGPAPARAAPDAGAGPFELIAARKLFEPAVAAMASQSITREELEGLYETLALIEARRKDHWEKLEVDRLFHMRIAEATHNSVVVEVIDKLWKEMQGPIFALLSERSQLTNKQSMTLADHRAIYGCIARRDAPAAHAAMLGHLVNVELTLLPADDAA
jgi:DNA-binding FadR family transcriptional regulator